MAAALVSWLSCGAAQGENTPQITKFLTGGSWAKLLATHSRISASSILEISLVLYSIPPATRWHPPQTIGRRSSGKSIKGGKDRVDVPQSRMTATRERFLSSLSTTAFVKCVVPMATRTLLEARRCVCVSVGRELRAACREFFTPSVLSTVVGHLAKLITYLESDRLRFNMSYT